MEALFTSARHDDESEWLSISDLMAVLMIVFLFIAIVYIRTYERQNDEIREIAVAWQENETEIYQALVNEFKDDLPKWNAEIEEKGLLVRFKSPDVLFETGKDTIQDKFAAILNNFFPRYAGVLAKYRESIEEVRIEGHTSSRWEHSTSERDAYYRNMRLSQARTRRTLEHALELDEVSEHRAWLRPLVTANGLSSSRPVLNETTGEEDPDRSRRVEFRIRTIASEEILRIVKVAE